MIKQININGKPITYNLKNNSRSRHLRITISEDSGLVVTLPWHLEMQDAERFILKKSRWITAKLKVFAQLPPRVLPRLSANDYKTHKGAALALANQKLQFYNSFYNFSYHRVSIKKQTTRWGSCSRKGNLNFNYRIVFLTNELVDYLIVHELCHLEQHNHSKNFWDLVNKTIPNYKQLRRRLLSLR